MLKLKGSILLLVSFISISLGSFAQIEEPVTWDLQIALSNEGTYTFTAKAAIEERWHVYASVISDDPEAFGPIPTSITFQDTSVLNTIGELREGEYITHYDPNFEMDLNYFEEEARFSQDFSFTGTEAVLTGELNYMACDDSKCIFPDPIYLELGFVNGILAYATANDEVFYGEQQVEENGQAIFEPATWSAVAKNNGDGSYTIEMTCTLDEGWHVYSQHLNNNEGPVPTSFTYVLPELHELMGPTQEETPEIHYDPNFMMDLAYFEGAPVFSQKIKVEGEAGTVKAAIDFMVCDEEMCLPPELIEFEVNLKSGVAHRAGLDGESIDVATLIPSLPKVDLEQPEGDCGEIKTYDSAWTVFIFGFIGGLIALLTPCVFPMIPLTVSFFTKGGQDKSSGIGKALLYGFFIFLIYALLSVPFHFGTDPEALNAIATSAWLNLLFFAVFIIFAISFFGFFEIRLPNSLLNKADNASNVGGVAGIFFMALTLALVSFSCTGPILGTVLGNSLKNGPWPITAAMSGFGIALGLPFAVFAAFPSMMQNLPKSGGWLNSVKVVLGFIEVALAVKFLSNADLVYQWHILERETFFLIWTIVGLGLVLYLLGMIRFPHDSPLQKRSIGRLTFTALIAAFTIYIAPGVMENPPWKHDLLAGFPPPSFYSWYAHDDGFHADFDNFDDAVIYAKEVNKPLLLDFTGWACVNCRKMEETVWTDPDIRAILEEHYVLVSLYVDDKNALPEAQQGVFEFEANGEMKKKRIRTIGNKWATFQTHVFKNNSQPYYVMLSANGDLLGNPVGYTPSISEYQEYLECGLETNDRLMNGGENALGSVDRE